MDSLKVSEWGINPMIQKSIRKIAEPATSTHVDAYHGVRDSGAWRVFSTPGVCGEAEACSSSRGSGAMLIGSVPQFYITTSLTDNAAGIAPTPRCHCESSRCNP